MTDHFSKMVEDNRPMLTETLEKLAAVIDEAADSAQADGRVVEPDSVFANAVIEWLADDNVIRIPAELQEDEHFLEHRFSAVVGRSRISCWGSALFRQPVLESSYDLHLFVSDWHDTQEPLEFRVEDYQKLSGYISNFFSKSVSGELKAQMNRLHPAYRVVSRINELAAQQKLASVRYWILTNRFFTGLEKSGRVAQNGIEMSAQIVDLGYLGKMLNGETEINQSFDDINGLAAIHIPAGEQQDYDCYLSAVRGSTLAQLYSKHGPAIVRANVRAYLGDVAVNNGIRQTVLEEPSRFLAYNNGLVISADSAVFENGRLRAIKGIQIINGGQTTASIYQTWLTAKNNRRDAGAVGRLEAKLDQIRIPMKIVVSREGTSEADRAQFRVRISQAANSQNAVKISDLSANTPFQIDFAKIVNNMRAPDGQYWFYESSRGLYKAELARLKGNRIQASKFKEMYPKERVFNKISFALAFLAAEGLAQDCAKGQEHAFRVFNEMIADRWNYDGGFKMTRDEAQKLVARQILFTEFEKSVKHQKSLGVKNPRVPVLYTLAVLHQHYGDRIHWDLIWNRQGLSDMFLMELQKLCKHIDQIIRSSMGNFMISMYGRQAACMTAIQQKLSLDDINLDACYELG